MIRTRICSLFGIDAPVVNAPMGGRASGALAAAVSEAGGLGLIGAMGYEPDGLREQIHIAKSRTSRPFGVGFVSQWLADEPELYDVAIGERVPVISHSFVDPAPYMDKARSVGAKVVVQVQTFEGARQAIRAGADAIVAQGNEAGGHTGSMAALPLVPQIVDLVAPTPVLAAGGIADGRGLAAALMLGAEGVWVGSAFLATPESGSSAAEKARVLAASSEDTVWTRSFDIVRGNPWPSWIRGRCVRNAVTDRWHDRDEELLASVEQVRAELEALPEDHPDRMSVWLGQAASMISSAEPAGDVVRRIVAQAERVLKNRSAIVT